MNDREKALKNFIELLFFIDKENKKFLDKIFKSKYISYSGRDILKETDGYKTLLMINYKFRLDIYNFYNFRLKNSIEYGKKFYKKNKLNNHVIERSLNDLDSIVRDFNNNYPIVKNENIEKLEDIEIYELMKETYSIWNNFKVLGMYINGKCLKIDLEYKKIFFSINVLNNLKDSIMMKYPDNCLSDFIFSNIQNYRESLIDLFEV